MAKSESLFIEIVNKSIENAEDLIFDADLLKKSSRIARAYALYQLAKEEIGKSIWVSIFLVNKDYEKPEKVDAFDKFFTSHRLKSKQAVALDFIIAQVIYKGNVLGALKKLENTQAERESTNKINDLKNYSLYTSIIDNKVINPKEIITQELLESIEYSTKQRYAAAKAFTCATVCSLNEIREYQKNKPDIEVNQDEFSKDFWNDILKNE